MANDLKNKNILTERLNRLSEKLNKKEKEM
jgi:hypothetical protein